MYHERLRQTLSRQHGLISTSQAHATGVPASSLAHAIASGRLERLSPRVLRLGGSAATTDQAAMAAALTVGGVIGVAGTVTLGNDTVKLANTHISLDNAELRLSPEDRALLEQLARLGQETPPVLGKDDPLANALEQLRAEPTFEILHLPADRALGETEFGRRAREAAMPRRAFEGLDRHHVQKELYAQHYAYLASTQSNSAQSIRLEWRYHSFFE